MNRCANPLHRVSTGFLLVLALASGCNAQAQDVPRAQLERADAVIELRQALRTKLDGTAHVEALPDILRKADGADGVEGRYRVALDLPAGRSGWAMYLSGAVGHARVAVNGQRLLDTITTPPAPRPRSFHMLHFVELPPHLLLERGNEIEITLQGQNLVSLSRIQLGAQQPLRDARDRKVMWMGYGPALVAGLMACLGLSVLLIWLRRRDETIYGYFGVASLAWGLHTAWTVSPREVIGGIHGAVVWTTLYAFLVGMLIIFCLRFVGRRLTRVERAIHWSLAAVPPLLYLSIALGLHDAADAAVRLAMVGGTFWALADVSRQAWQTRSRDGRLLVLAGLVAASFGLRDWIVSETSNDYVPVVLSPYAGMPFVALMAWLLIDRFVRNTEALEGLNRGLEQRVAQKSAELVTALNDMRTARDGADAANRAKSGFLAAASHDLRQPIHALGLYMSALRGRPLDAAAQEIVQRMDGSVAALDSLFNALLDISRMDAGTVTAQPQAIDLAQWLHRLAGDMAGEATQRGLRFAARIGASATPVVAHADPLLLERVLRNLIANALKYTQSGGVLLTCRARRGPPRHWRVEVWDSGPGIAERERERVFDEFYQGGNPERDRRSGLGLGLSIVRRLAQLMGTPLSLHSRVGHGTRFVIDIPVGQGSPSVATGREAHGRLGAMTVAVIEDDLEVRDAMVTLLQSWGCLVAAGADAQDVLNQADLRGLVPQAVVADMRLREGCDGVDAVARMRARWGAALPALLVSGDSAPERVRLMQDSGIPWLSKPVPAARLKSWLMTAVAATQPPQATAAATQGADP